MKKNIINMGSRGMRNNNPFNMNKTDSLWLGLVPGSDVRFASFIDLEHGVRAGLINLFNGYFSRNLTLRQIVGKYAPASDNNNELAYVEAIRKKTGIIGEQVPSKGQWLSVASAILFHENGFEVMNVDQLKEVVIKFKLSSYGG
ncbi:MAG TPA: hypothetical protein VMV77_02255 [Bacteroidales bacterium]|nr:hypothetical protein [Bacteroidales bacterium]